MISHWSRISFRPLSILALVSFFLLSPLNAAIWSGAVAAASASLKKRGECGNQLTAPTLRSNRTLQVGLSENRLMTLDFHDLGGKNHLTLKLGSTVFQNDVGIVLFGPGFEGGLNFQGGAAVVHTFILEDLVLQSSTTYGPDTHAYVFTDSGQENSRVDVVFSATGALKSVEILHRKKSFFFGSVWKQSQSIEGSAILFEKEFKFPEIRFSPEVHMKIWKALWFILEVPDHEFAPNFEYRKGLIVNQQRSKLREGISPAEIVDIVNGLASLDKETGIAIMKELFGNPDIRALYMNSLRIAE
jgi:hypothetical protein